MRVLHIDPSIGCAGDMLLAALVDAGANPARIHDSVQALLPGAAVAFTQTTRCGLRATQARVQAPTSSPHRLWSDLSTAITVAPLEESVRLIVFATFERLARAEGRVHGVEPASVHFHEVGAWDSICDVVGVAAAIVDLAVDHITSSPIGTGVGTVATEHGLLPLPGPAVAELMAAAKLPTQPGPARFEACTPTAAALLATVVTHWQGGPHMHVERVGVGAGTADPEQFPNITRVFVGTGGPAGTDSAGEAPGAVVLSTNVDDIDPRLWPDVLQQLLDAGASDAWLTPILMKKGRPATQLNVLCRDDQHGEVAGIIMATTPAIGMRVQPVGKIAASRSMKQVAVLGQPISIKVASWQGRVVNVQPEWRDVAAAALAVGVPAKEVLATAHGAAAHLWDGTAQRTDSVPEST